MQSCFPILGPCKHRSADHSAINQFDLVPSDSFDFNWRTQCCVVDSDRVGNSDESCDYSKNESNGYKETSKDNVVT